jgi:signal transduction histidine kinase
VPVLLSSLNSMDNTVPVIHLNLGMLQLYGIQSLLHVFMVFFIFFCFFFNDIMKKEEIDDYDSKVLFCSKIAHPLASKKLNKKVLKVVKKATKSKSVKRGVKEVVKGVRKGFKGYFFLFDF